MTPSKLAPRAISARAVAKHSKLASQQRHAAKPGKELVIVTGIWVFMP
jgi:16S rRNA G527 N7-methylase RsmG